MAESATVSTVSVVVTVHGHGGRVVETAVPRVKPAPDGDGGRLAYRVVAAVADDEVGCRSCRAVKDAM